MLTPKATQKSTYNHTLANIKEIIQNPWSILKTSKALEKTFSVESIIAFCKKQKSETTHWRKYDPKRKNIKKSGNKYEGKCTPCKSGMRSLCCLQVQNTHSFRSQQNGRIFTIFHQVSCKSDFLIYRSECQKCHIQYVGKTETDFNLRLNNHLKDVYKAVRMYIKLMLFQLYAILL